MWSSRRVRNAADRLVQPGADPGHLRLGDPGPAQRDDQVVDRAGGHAVDVGLHHHRIQGLVDPPARRQDLGKNDPARSFGIASCDVAGLRGEQPRPGTVALSGPRLGALVAAGADHLGRFGLDQLLQHHPHRLPDQSTPSPVRNASNNSDTAD